MVARGHEYKHGHVPGRGPGHPPLAPGEAPSASRVQQGWCREPEPAAWGKPLSLHGSGRQVEILILTLWPQYIPESQSNLQTGRSACPAGVTKLQPGHAKS